MSSARSFKRAWAFYAAQWAIVVPSTSQRGGSKQLVIVLFSGPLCLIRYRAVLSLSDDTGGTKHVKNIKCLKARELHKERRLRLPEPVTVARFWFPAHCGHEVKQTRGHNVLCNLFICWPKWRKLLPALLINPLSTAALANRCCPTTSFWLARPAGIDSVRGEAEKCVMFLLEQ